MLVERVFRRCVSESPKGVDGTKRPKGNAQKVKEKLIRRKRNLDCVRWLGECVGMSCRNKWPTKELESLSCVMFISCPK